MLINFSAYNILGFCSSIKAGPQAASLYSYLYSDK